MEGRWRYRAHGLKILSAVPLPAPEIVDNAAVPDVIVRSDPQPPLVAKALHERVDDERTPWITERWVGGRIFVEFEDTAVFEISEREIVIRRLDTDDSKLIAHRVLDHVLPRVVGLRGDLMLHASGVVAPNGGAYLFVGDSGAGKSTLASGLACRGWQLLGDDGIRVVIDGKTPMAMPAHPGVRLYPEVAAAIAASATSRGVMAEGFAKHRYELPGANAIHGAPVRSIVLLDGGPGGAPERLALGLALSRLAVQTFHMACDPGDLSRTAFDTLSPVVAAVQVHRLRQAETLDDHRRIIDEIRDFATSRT